MKMKLYNILYCFLVFPHVANAQLLDKPELHMNSVLVVPEEPEVANFDNISVRIPANWKRYMTHEGTTMQLVSSHGFLIGDREQAFKVLIRKAGRPNMSLPDFVKKLKLIYEANDGEMRKVMQSRADSNNLDLKVDVIPKFEISNVMRGEHNTINSVQFINASKDSSVVLLEVRSMMYFTEDQMYILAFSYPVKDSERFKDIAKWLMGNISIKLSNRVGRSF